MKYITLPLTECEAFFEKWYRKRFPCRLSMLCEPGVMMIAPGKHYINLPEDGKTYKLLKLNHCGGPIVGFDDGITLFDINRNEWRPQWREKLVKLLRSKGIQAENEGNDVTAQGFKVAGYSETVLADTGFVQYGIHIPMHVDVDEIRRICCKPMVKIPKGLADYGLTRAEVLRALDVEETI